MWLKILRMNEWQHAVAEQFIRTLKKNLYKYVTAISKNVHIDKLSELYRESKNTIHRLIKPDTYIDFDNNINIKTNLMLMIVWEYQNIKILFQKIFNQIGQRTYLLLKKSLKKKVINCMSNGKDMIIVLIVG